MDECKQRWSWLRDIKQVTELLVLGCIAGPAFATNLFDWRFLVNELRDDPNYNFFLLPWTPEFACQMAQKHPNMHQIVLGIQIDPATKSPEAALALQEQWQTENGKEPQFKTFELLKAHAEQEYQKFQQQLEKRRELAAKQKESDEQVIQLLARNKLRRKSMATEEKEALKKYAGDPKTLKKFNQMADKAVLESEAVLKSKATMKPAKDSAKGPLQGTHQAPIDLEQALIPGFERAVRTPNEPVDNVEAMILGGP
ncbi:hypothetical protein CIB48_g10573 [Xylaria polymorpha]|nr:hypothetical protein CIB48_g10573 [Xylaria polymorpha]